MSRLDLVGVDKSHGRVPALRGVDLAVRTGERFALVGPSGSGKTTALRVLAGLDAPDAGDVRVDGVSVLGVPPERRGLGVVFQRPLLFAHLSVAENLAFGLRARGARGRAVAEPVAALLGRLGLDGLGARRPHELSGGQQQRVALGRALAPSPRALLLDEPFSALDAPLRRELRAWLVDLHAALGATTVLVTHDQEEAVAVGERLGFLHEGRLVQVGPPEELYARPATLGVARFFGGANFVPGEQDGRAVRSALGVFEAATDRAGPVTLTFRPEAPRRAEAGDARNVVRGVVTRAAFAGTHREVALRAAGIDLVWRAPPFEAVAVGEELALAVAPGACWTLPEDAPGPGKA